MEDTILYPSCFDANAGLFEAILTDRDAIISDELNHASIIDGVRLCKVCAHCFSSFHFLLQTRSPLLVPFISMI
jgi:glycine C-acetyltransferase